MSFLNKKPNQDFHWLKVINICSLLLIIFSLLTTILLLYSYYQLKMKVHNYEVHSKIIYFSYILAVITHLSVAITIIIDIRKTQNIKILGIISFLMFVISFISLGADVGALNDIGNDYLRAGYPCLFEWTWLFLGLIIHFSFYIICLIFLIKVFRYLKNIVLSKYSQTFDSLFEITHLTGIICSGTGLFLVFLFFLFFFN